MESIGRYQLEGEVARGGMGAVHRGRAPDGRPVAVKLLVAGSGASPAQRARFATETRAQLRIRHPNVVALLDAGEVRGLPYLVQEWVEGETLEARLEREGPLHPRDAAELVRRLALGLAACHAQGVLHRDLKPANVLLRAGSGDPLLTDFGLARDLEASASRSSPTVSGLWLGTPGWWPPEQARGELERVGTRSDVYGLGAVLYGALTGGPPRELASPLELLQALERAPVPPGQLRPGIAPWLEAVCLRALADAPEERWPSAAALAAELGRGGRVGRTRSRVLPGVGLACLLIGSAAWFLTRGEARRDAPVVASAAPASSSAGPTGAWDPEDFRRRVGLLRDQDDAAGVLVLAEQASAKEPRSWLAHATRAEALMQLRRLDEALSSADRAVELGPGESAPYLIRGEIRNRRSELRAALEDAERAVANEPDSVRGLVLRADLRRDLGDRPGALRDAERALELDPRSTAARLSRGYTLVELNRAREALPELDRVLAARPSAQALLARAEARRLVGDLRGALEDATRAIELAPQMGQAYTSRALTRATMNDYASCVTDLNRAVELAPHDAGALLTRAQVREELGDARGALSDYRQALEINPALARQSEAEARIAALERRLGR